MFLALLELLCDERCSKTKCPIQHSVIANCNKTLKSKGLLAVHLILTTILRILIAQFFMRLPWLTLPPCHTLGMNGHRGENRLHCASTHTRTHGRKGPGPDLAENPRAAAPRGGRESFQVCVRS